MHDAVTLNIFPFSQDSVSLSTSMVDERQGPVEAASRAESRFTFHDPNEYHI